MISLSHNYRMSLEVKVNSRVIAENKKQFKGAGMLRMAQLKVGEGEYGFDVLKYISC